MAAGILLYLIMRLRGSPAPTGKQWVDSALLGGLMVVGGNGLLSFAEQWVASGISAVAMAAIPLWTALFVGLTGRWPTAREALGLGLGFVGVILLNMENGLWAAPLGALALLIAPISWSFGSALSSRLSLPKGLMASATQMIVGGSLQLLIGLLLGERMQAWPTPQSIWIMVYLITFGALVAYTAYGYLLRNVRPALATSYAYVNPMVAVVLGIALAGEKITLVGIVAMCVILTGVGLVSLRMRKPS